MSDVALKYEPNRTLGGSGYVDLPFDKLGQRLKQLDALLMVMSGADNGTDGMSDFERFNDEIKRAVLDLAQDLAHEAHELHEQLTCEQAAKIPAGSH